MLTYNNSDSSNFYLEFITMPILETAKKYFDEDIERAKKLLLLAKNDEIDIPNNVKDDLLRSAWMFTVGACDAYFCDAYADLITRTYKAKEKEPDRIIPKKLGSQVLTVNEHYKLTEDGAWGWRNFARKKIEKESVLSLEEPQDLMNVFLRGKEKILSDNSVENWILHKDCKRRLVGIPATDYKNLKDGDKHEERKRARKQIKKRFEEIFKRRHDCIHNCDRPKNVPQDITAIEVEKVIEDIDFLVNRCQGSFVNEFPFFLLDECGFSTRTKNQVCAGAN